MSNILIDRIAKDLNISRFNNEAIELFGNRIIYSAVAAWIRTALLGKSYSDIELDNDELSVDVMHLIQRVKPIATALISTIPHGDKWFLSDELSSMASNCVKIIHLNMVLCNEVAVMNNRRRMSISPEKKLEFGNNSIVLGGVSWQTPDRRISTFGIGRWIKSKSEGLYNLNEELSIPSISALDWLNRLLKDVPWRNKIPEGDFKIFVPRQLKWHKDSWILCNVFDIPQGISLLKNRFGAYVLVKKTGDIIKTVLLDQWYYKTKEICRIMYAISEKMEEPACFDVKLYDDCVVLHIHSRIPKAEERLILLTSWPHRNISDPFIKVIPMRLWKDVKNVLENLGIVCNEKADK